MKQIFKFKLEDGTVVTGANPVEALMKVNASTTGKNLDAKFKKEKQEKEVGNALVEFEKLYDGYLDLEKKLKTGVKFEKTAEVVVNIPEEKVENQKEEEQAEEQGKENKQKEDTPVITTPVKLFGVKEGIVTTDPEKIESGEESEKDLKSMSVEKLFELVENEAKKLTNSVSTIYYILSGYDIGGRITREQNKAVLKMINEKYPDGDKVAPITPDKIQETKEEIEKIIDSSNESKVPKVEKLNRVQLEKEINENIRQLLDKEKDKEPEIKKFEFLAIKNGFLIKSTINIRSGEPGDKIRVRKDVDIELSLENRNGHLSLGQEKIESWPITKIVRRKFEPLLPQIIPGIKFYFENKYKQNIKSMKIENEELVIEFE